MELSATESTGEKK